MIHQLVPRKQLFFNTIMIVFFAMQGMGDFLNEMAVMMSQNKSNVSVLPFVCIFLFHLIQKI